MTKSIIKLIFVTSSMFFLSIACTKKRNYQIVKIDGSSTVFPITEAIAEEFGKTNSNIRVTVAVSGTGGGFKKFSIGEIDINNASRRIKQSEIDKSRERNTEYLEIPVAFDGISVVVNKSNTWVDYFTVEELKKIWNRGSTITRWNQIRPHWPNKKIRLYGPGPDSGTFDYFTKVINGKSHVSRSDFTKSEDDNVILQGVAGDKNSLGFFGFAHYINSQKKVRAVPIKKDISSKAILPSHETINKGTYSPLSRLLFIYVSIKSLKENKAVLEFVRFYLKKSMALVSDVGYVPLPKQDYLNELNKIENILL